MNKEERSVEVREACVRRWRNNRDAVRDRRNGFLLTYDRQPDYVYNKDGEIVGVDAWVRMHGPSGIETKIDPHRRIINPPMLHGENEDPLSAFMDVVWDSVVKTPNPKGWRTRGTVDTIFTSSDGRVEAQGSSYSVAREGAGTTIFSTSTATTAIGQNPNGTNSVYQQFWAFDTSAIIDTDIVSAVDLQLYMVADISGGGFILEFREKDWGSSLEALDFIPGSQLSSYTLLASLDTTTLGSAGAYKTFTSTSAFLTTTNIKTGTVKLFGSSSHQRLNVAPSSGIAEYVQFSMSATSGTTQDPKLVITHAAPVIPSVIGWGRVPIA